MKKTAILLLIAMLALTCAALADAPADAAMIGEWKTADGTAAMTIAKDPDGERWDVEIACSDPPCQFAATIRYYEDQQRFFYSDGRFGDVDGSIGAFAVAGDPRSPTLTWSDDERPGELTFHKVVSKIYTREDMDAALAVIDRAFASWNGFVMKDIRYAGDECNAEANIAWLEGLKGKDYAQCIEFLAEIHTPANSLGSLEPDTDYSNYEFWLARGEGGSWDLVSWGY